MGSPHLAFAPGFIVMIQGLRLCGLGLDCGSVGFEIRVWRKFVLCGRRNKKGTNPMSFIYSPQLEYILLLSLLSALTLVMDKCGNNFLLVHIRLRNHNSLELCIHPLHPYLRRILAVKVICCRLTPKTSIHSHVIDVYIASVWLVSCLVVSLYHFYLLKTHCLLRNAIFIMCF